MVIFGAGASYDSAPTYPPPPPNVYVPGGDAANNFHRPPLANELFANRPLFAGAIDRFPECRPIVPRLRNLGKRSIEAVLEDIQREAETYPAAKQELAAICCYLHQVITETEDQWRAVTKQITNYLTLLREIERTHKAGEPVCLVTFNYDTPSNTPSSISASASRTCYTKRHPFYRLFKLHGSVTWARQVEPDIVPPNRTHPVTALRTLVQRVAELRITDGYIFSPDRTMGVVQGKLAFPAIAIPVEKKSSFECPQHMIDELTGLLPQVSKMLVIGWRATEKHFLALLKEHLKPMVFLYTVAHDHREAVEINTHIQAALPDKLPDSFADPDASGFTQFMLTDRAKQFLSR